MMRSLRHPGPIAAERVRLARCVARPVELQLEAGLTVNEAITGALAKAGFASGYVDLAGIDIEPMRYVIPAPAPDASHVAWYSETHAPDGVFCVERAGVIAGSRDGQPFIHCHGIWTGSDGIRRAGHILPHEAVIAQTATVKAYGIEGAAFIARDDAETNFKLFAAEETGANSEGGSALICTVRPNGDISAALESACRDVGISNARILGVGSLVGVDFTDGRHVPSYATEVFFTDGIVADEAVLDVALVDMDGTVHEGRLTRGQNPVCVTFEILLVRED